MPRRKKLPVGLPPHVAAGETHAMRVIAFKLGTKRVVVTLQPVTSALEGLVFQIEREYPINPLGLVGQLLKACGLEVTSNTSVEYWQCEGWIVLSTFGLDCHGQTEITNIQPFNGKEESHVTDRQRQTGRLQAGPAKPQRSDR